MKLSNCKIIDVSGSPAGVVNVKPVLGKFGRLVSDWSIGLEYEYEAVTNTPGTRALIGAGWEAVGDGSLRDHGMEFRFREPLNGKTASDSMTKMHEWARKYGYRDSRRTSTHVHINMTHLTMDAVARILATYALMEPALFTLVEADRESNIYCVPFYRADKTDVEQLATIYAAYDGFKEQRTTGAWWRSQLNGGTKYSALNYRTLRQFGTLEFRQAGIMNRRDTFRWVNTLLTLCHYGVDMPSTEEIISTYERMGAIDFCRAVLGDLYGHLNIRALNASSGKSLQAFNDDVDVLSIAERVGGVLPTRKHPHNKWATPDAIEVQRRNKRPKPKARKRGETPAYLMQDTPTG
jgi:hypothetical protein